MLILRLLNGAVYIGHRDCHTGARQFYCFFTFSRHVHFIASAVGVELELAQCRFVSVLWCRMQVSVAMHITQGTEHTV